MSSYQEVAQCALPVSSHSTQSQTYQVADTGITFQELIAKVVIVLNDRISASEALLLETQVSFLFLFLLLVLPFSDTTHKCTIMLHLLAGFYAMLVFDLIIH